MTCDHCCGAEKFFDDKTARKELKKYRKSGPRGATRKIVDGLDLDQAHDRTLLDIGGGIGIIQWQFLTKGGLAVTDIDASGPYLSVAEEYAREKGWEGKTSFVKADFTDRIEVDQHDYVTLDKVVCCYPDFRSLLELATDKCNYQIALSYPLGGFVPKALSGLAALYFKIKGNPFRTYIHPRKAIRGTIESRGFSNVSSSLSFPWRIEIWQRN